MPSIRKIIDTELNEYTKNKLEPLNANNKKRGRPIGSKNKKTRVIIHKSIEEPLPDDPNVVAREGLYKFVSDKCQCVFYKSIVGSGMFCKHRHPMHLDTDTRTTTTADSK